jgi:hypothetical protein
MVGMPGGGGAAGHVGIMVFVFIDRLAIKIGKSLFHVGGQSWKLPPAPVVKTVVARDG